MELLQEKLFKATAPGGIKMKKRAVQPFHITDYRLIPGTEIYKKTILNAGYLLAMDVDSLLYTFRINAGLDTKGAQPLTGWEAPHLHFRGQFMGHYLAACARMSLTLRELKPDLAKQFGDRTEEIVKELYLCQRALAGKEKHPGYLAAVESSMLDDLEQLHFTGVFTVVYYNLHKIMSGLLEVYTLLGNKLALEILQGMADYIGWHMSKLTDERIEQMLETRWYREDDTTFHMEFGGMAEVLLRLYRESGNPEHLSLARKFDRKWFRYMLMEKRDLLGHYSLHANTEIPCVIGLAEYEDLIHDGEAGECVDQFLIWLQNGHTLPTGGVSGRSAYTDPADYGGELFEFPHMYYKHTNFKCGESCCSHNLNILARKEFQWTADSRWMQEHERRYVNAVLAQQHPINGGFVYNLRLGQGSLKGHSTDGFFCCNGTGVETHAFLAEGAFFHERDQLWVTNYVPCDLLWKEQEAVIESRTEFPAKGRASWTIQMETAKKLTVHVRIPDWAEGKAKLKINGESAGTVSGGFWHLERTWRNGDRIEADFPYSLRVERMEDRPEYVAIFYGPHLLVACTEAWAKYDGTEAELLASMKPAKEPCEFETVLSAGRALYRPVCYVTDEQYNGYTIVSRPVPFRIVDEMIIGDEDSEKNHRLKYTEGKIDKSEQGVFLQCQYPGIFSCSFTARADRKLWLKCYFQDRGVLRRHPEETVEFNQCFRFEIEDKGGKEEIAVQTLQEKEGECLTEVYYPVMEREGEITLTVSGSAYEGRKRGTAKFYNRIELGYFEE